MTIKACKNCLGIILAYAKRACQRLLCNYQSILCKFNHYIFDYVILFVIIPCVFSIFFYIFSRITIFQNKSDAISFSINGCFMIQ